MILNALLLVAASQPSLHREVIQVDDVDREALIYLPEAKSVPPSGAPVVFMFHGHGGNMRNAARTFQMEQRWPEAAVVYMQGLPTPGKTDPEGKKNGWQQNKGQQNDRDLKFFDQELARIKKRIKVDPKRVYAGGFSNGGRFTYLLWGERSNLIAAFVPGASPNFGISLSPKPSFVIAGEKDQVVPFAGQRLSIERIARLVGVKEGDSGKSSQYLTTKFGKDGIEASTYIHPGGHVFPREANALIVEFFKRNSLR